MNKKLNFEIGNYSIGEIMMTQTEVIKAFDTLPKNQKLIVAKKIQRLVADELFEEMDREMPDIEISTEEIQKEILAYRNAKKKED